MGLKSKFKKATKKAKKALKKAKNATSGVTEFAEKVVGHDITDPFETMENWYQNVEDVLTGDRNWYSMFDPAIMDPAFVGTNWTWDLYTEKITDYMMGDMAIGGGIGSPTTDPSSPTYSRNNPVNTYENSVPLSLICGKCKVGGNIIYQGGTEEMMNMFVSLGEGPVASISDVRLDNVPVSDIPGVTADIYEGTSTQEPSDRFAVTTHQAPGLPLKLWDLETNGFTPDPMPSIETSFTVNNDTAIVYLTLQSYFPWKSTTDKTLTFKLEYKDKNSGTWTDGGNYTCNMGTASAGMHDIRFPVKPDVHSNPKPLRYKRWKRIIVNAIAAVPTELNLYSEEPNTIQTCDINVEHFTAAEYDLRLTVLGINSGGNDNEKSAWLKLSEIEVEERYGAQAFRNTAYIAAEVPRKELSGSKPNITSIVEGFSDVKYWNGSAWTNGYTTNPVWHVRNILTHTRVGLGIDEARIDDDSFIAAAAYCDELVNDVKRFEYNRVIDNRRSAGDWIKEILLHCRGLLWRDAGIIYIAVEQQRTAVASIDVDEIIEGTFEFWHESLEDVPDSLKATYIDPDDDYEQRQFVLGEKTPDGKDMSISLVGCTNKAQAERIAYYIFNKLTRTAHCSFSTPLSTIALEKGDVVELFHPVPPLGYDISDPDAPVKLSSGVEFIIDSYTDSDTDVREYECSLYDASVFSDDLQISTPLPATSPVPNPFRVPKPVENLSTVFVGDLTDDGVWNPEVMVSWTQPEPAGIVGWKIYQSRNAGKEWEQVAYHGSNTPYKWKVPELVGDLLVKVVPVGFKEGSFNAAMTGTVVVPLDTEAPEAPADLAGTFGQTVVWTWTKNTERDFSHYEMSLDNWASVIEYYLGQVQGYYPDGYFGGASVSSDDDSRVCRYELSAPTQRSYTLSVKAVDKTGNKSDAVDATASITEPGSPSVGNLQVEKAWNQVRLWVDDSFQYTPQHTGFQFKWSLDDSVFTDVNTKPSSVGTIIVDLSAFSQEQQSCNIYVRYREWDVVGASTHWSASKTIVVTSPNADQVHASTTRQWAAEAQATNDEQWQEGSSTTVSRKIKAESLSVRAWNRVYNWSTQPGSIIDWSPTPITRTTDTLDGKTVGVAEASGAITSRAFQVSSNRNYRFIVAGRVTAAGGTQKVSIRVYEDNGSGEKGTEISAYSCDLSVAGELRDWVSPPVLPNPLICDFWSGQLPETEDYFKRFECFVVGYDTPAPDVPEDGRPGARPDKAFKLPPNAAWVEFVLDGGTQTAHWFSPSVADAEGGTILAHRVQAATVSALAMNTGTLTVDSTGYITTSNFAEPPTDGATPGAGFKLSNGKAEFYGGSTGFDMAIGGPLYSSDGNFMIGLGLKLTTTGDDKRYPQINSTNFETDGQFHLYKWNSTSGVWEENATIGLATDQTDYFTSYFKTVNDYALYAQATGDGVPILARATADNIAVNAQSSGTGLSFWGQGGKRSICGYTSDYPYHGVQATTGLTDGKGAGLTGLGAFVCGFYNMTGSNTTNGQVVKLSTSNNDAFVLVSAGGADAFGVVVENQISSGTNWDNVAQVAIAGKAYVGLDSSVTTVNRGDALRVSSYNSEAGRATNASGSGQYLGRAIRSFSIPTATTWTASTTYAVNDCVNPTAGANPNFYYQAVVAGTSDITEPNWSQYAVNGIVGDTIIDGTSGGVTWRVKTREVFAVLTIEHG